MLSFSILLKDLLLSFVVVKIIPPRAKFETTEQEPTMRGERYGRKSGND